MPQTTGSAPAFGSLSLVAVFKPAHHTLTVEREELAALKLGALVTAIPDILCWCMSQSLKPMVIEAWLRKALSGVIGCVREQSLACGQGAQSERE